MYLLDIVYNEIPFRKYGFDEMCAVADELSLCHKELAFVLETWQDFYDWFYLVRGDDYRYNGRLIEGFVLEDSAGYMIKLKLAYYNFWKFMRSIAHETIRKGYVDRKRTAALTTPLANQFYGWVKTLYTTDAEEAASIPRDICTLRRMFLETETGKQFALE